MRGTTRKGPTGITVTYQWNTANSWCGMVKGRATPAILFWEIPKGTNSAGQIYAPHSVWISCSNAGQATLIRYTCHLASTMTFQIFSGNCRGVTSKIFTTMDEFTGVLTGR